MQITKRAALLTAVFCLLGVLGAPKVNAQQGITAGEVNQVVLQAIAEAQAQGVAATIAVVDRVGNVLGVFEMTGANQSALISSGKGIPAGNGLEGLTVPAAFAAISKAITGAYLSSGGNAFTSRTANQIVQEHFNPGEFNQMGGPLFGVQFSQLLCSDLTVKGATQGPSPAPLGLSADPGGIPLYKGGEPVGGIGVMVDGIYGVDLNITSGRDRDIDEIVALAGTRGFEPPTAIRADRITVDGKTFRYTDVEFSDLASVGANAPTPADPTGSFIAVSGFTDGNVRNGTVFGTAPSGFVPSADFGVPALVLGGRFPPRGGTTGANALTAPEVQTLIASALAVANRARAQIRNPPNSGARVTVSIVDSNGVILGIARTLDAPIFGTDVSLQKARTAAFFSRPDAGAQLQAAGQGGFVAAVRAFGLPTALADGIAFSDRAGGNLSRPFYPDGIDGNPNGPFSVPIGVFSPFNVGLQLSLVAARITTPGSNCTGLPGLANGIQIFPGSVPIYRGAELVGAIGISGDGVDQDDMIAFLGLHNAGQILGTINNADPAIRADNLAPLGARLRYINCPQRPFIDSSEADPCDGK